MGWCWRKYVTLLPVIAFVIITRAGYVESCKEEERIALLDLNPYFISHLESDDVQSFVGIGNSQAFGNYNCCSWERVKCSTTTQHVVHLDLSYIMNFDDQSGWVLNVTMLKRFRQLTSLDLSGNYIIGFTRLSTLKNLQSLVLQGFEGAQINLSDLTSLKTLNLASSNLNETSLQGKLSLSSFADHNKLQFLDLSQNHLQVQTEDSLWQPSFHLQYLGLQGCSLNHPNGIFPKFLSEQNNLSYIDLSYNNLVRPFPSFLISNNSIPEDDFSLENGNLDALASYSRRYLESLTISGNNFHGELPENIGYILPQLKLLNVSSCHFEGAIPTSIAHMSQLQVLDLSFNNFSGELPRQLLSDLTQLETLMLNDNDLEGDIIPDYMNLPLLKILNLRNNHFNGTIKDGLRRSSSLYWLDISNNNVVGFLPRWIGQFDQLRTLSVSKNSMEGQIPMGICIENLDLSENNFNGSIPSCSDLSAMLLRHNKFTGGIPSALSSASGLMALDLRDNQLSGGIPLWINKLQSLEILLLGGNNFRGQLPHQLCELQSINLLDLSRNQLSGRILTCLGNMSFGSLPTTILTYTLFHSFPEDYYVQYDFSIGVGEIDSLLVKTMYLPYVGFDLSHMSILDLSDNNFSGIIPPELGILQHVHSINLSHNCFSETIPANLSNLKEIEALDLSYNNLSGIIPYQLVQIYSLEVFNVSYNNLTGRAPEAAQFGNFDETSYLGNPGLCVSLLSKSCNRVSDNDTPPLTSTAIEEDGGEGLDMEDFLWTFGATSIIAFMATITVLSINRQWREAFFDFVEWHLLWWLL